jgi:hypothetical protein
MEGGVLTGRSDLLAAGVPAAASWAQPASAPPVLASGRAQELRRKPFGVLLPRRRWPGKVQEERRRLPW